MSAVGQIGGPTRAVAMFGDKLLAGVGAQVVTLDVSAASTPKEVDRSPALGGPVEAIATTGQIVAVALGAAGVAILDGSTGQLRLHAALPLGGYAEGVSFSGQNLFVADGPSGLRVIDTSDPDHPKEIASAVSLNYAFDLSVVDHFAYVAAAGAGVIVIDIADPRHPIPLERLELPGYAFGVAASDGIVAVADGWEGLAVLDATAPATPKLVGSVTLPGWALRVSLRQRTAVVAGGAAGVRLVDMSDPRAASDLGGMSFLRALVTGAVTDGRSIFAADQLNGVRVLDAKAQREIATFAPLAEAHAAVVAKGVAYVAAENGGLRVIDVTTPNAPREVAGLPTLDEVVYVSLAGSRLLVWTQPQVDTKQPSRATVFSLDIAEPLAPRVLGGRVYTNVRSVAVQGTTQYDADEAGLLILDGSGSEVCRLGYLVVNPNLSDPTSHAAVGVAVSGTAAYLGVGQRGLLSIDLSDLRDPKVVGTFTPTPSCCLDVLATAQLVYALDGKQLLVIDAADPKQLRLLGSLSLPGDAPSGALLGIQGMALAGGHLLVARGGAGLVAIDVSDPAEPRIAGQLRLPGYTAGVFADGSVGYASSSDGGLITFALSADAPSGPTASPIALPVLPTGDGPAVASTDAPRRAPPEITAAADCVVTSVDDSGPGTLRECVRTAPGAGVIRFDPLVFAAAQPGVIRLKSALALGKAPRTAILGDGAVVIDGAALNGKDGGCVAILGDGHVVRGLRIQNCPGALTVSGTGNVIGGAAPGDRNVFSSNRITDIQLKQASGTWIYGNYIGTDPTGTEASGSSSESVAVFTGSGGNRIERNVIARSVFFNDRGTSFNEVVGNMIGVDVTGSRTFGGEVFVASSEPFNRVGGVDPVERNVIAGTVVVASYNFVLGNYIGLDATGTRPIAVGGQPGVDIPGLARHAFVGGASGREANLIAVARDGSGVRIGDSAASNFVLGNRIFGGQLGFQLIEAQGNFIQGNLVRGAKIGIGLTEGSESNVFRANQLEQGQIGVQALDSGRNVFTRNAFRANGRDRDDQSAGNVFD